MATLEELCDSGHLIRVRVDLARGTSAFRRLYAIPAFINWLENELTKVPHDQIYCDLSPLEQVAVLFDEFISGEPLIIDRRFRRLRRSPSFGVWELKTDDVRIFGWFPEKDAFVMCFGDSATNTKIYNRYEKYMAQVNFIQVKMPLKDPKVEMSEDPADVVSAKN
jgi:hypothetical protein